MIRTKILSVLLCLTQNIVAQETTNQLEFDAFIEDLETEFIYYQDKKEVIACIKESYRSNVDTISQPYYKVLFYENLLNELYDSHIILNTNTDKSYRLTSPIYVSLSNNSYVITSVFTSQLANKFSNNIINAEVLSFNGQRFQKAIEDFPTTCHDKTNPVVREWLANKVLAGKRNLPRLLELKLSSGKQVSMDMDTLKFKNNDGLLTSFKKENIGIIRVNNSLGNSDLVPAFRDALIEMMDTDALIIDLRNTPGGGNTGVAEPIMGRFISEKKGYQICENETEKYTRFIFPSGEHYSKPLYILVGRWTGSMGEGMTIGLDGIARATVVGTEMNRLAGGMKTINFLNSTFGYRISFEKMYHLDGSLRETFVPKEYVEQRDISKDEHLEHAFNLIKARNK